MLYGDRSFNELKAGDTWTGVVEAFQVNGGVTLVAKWKREALQIQGEHPTSGVFTVYDFIFCGMQGDIAQLEKKDASGIFERGVVCTKTFRTLVDLCSGLGGLSQGVQSMQGQVLLHVDKSALATQHVMANGGAALQGDIGNPQVQRALHDMCQGKAVSVGSGFPCQPYSRQGSRLGVGDPRSLTLFHVLQCVWRLQAASAVLECVPEITQHGDIMRQLHAFAEQAGFQVCTTVLDLAQCWASRRQRWWCCLGTSLHATI